MAGCCACPRGLRRRVSLRWRTRWRGLVDDPDPERRAGVVGDRPHGYAARLRWPGLAGAGDVEAQSAQRTSVRLSGPARRADQGAVARRARDVPVREAIGAWPLPVAIDGSPRGRGHDSDDHAGPTGIFARSPLVMPLLLMLTLP